MFEILKRDENVMVKMLISNTKHIKDILYTYSDIMHKIKMMLQALPVGLMLVTKHI